ncbi:hypothetical protein AYI69_g6073, partial [Smittium culicis]
MIKVQKSFNLQNHDYETQLIIFCSPK